MPRKPTVPDGTTALDIAGPREVYAYIGEPLEAGEEIPWRELVETSRRDGDDLYVVTRHMASSDDSITRSNRRSFLRDFGHVAGFHPLGEFGLTVRADVSNERLLGALADLDDYPIYDESDHSALEIEDQSKAIDEWAAYDLYHALLRVARVDDVDEGLIMGLFDANMFHEQFWQLAEATGAEWTDSSDGATINVEKIAKGSRYLDLLNAGDYGSLSGARSRAQRTLVDLFGLEATEEQVEDLIDWLWLEEGIQPEAVLGPFSEASLEARMNLHRLDRADAVRVGELVAGMTPEGQRLYEGWANVFTKLGTLISAINAAKAETEDDPGGEVDAFAELAPEVISTMNEVNALVEEQEK